MHTKSNIIFINKFITKLKKNVGRPTKINAKKSGELNQDEMYFNFIVRKDIVNSIKKKAIDQGITIKKLMDKTLNKFKLKKENQRIKASKKNEEKLLEYMKSKKCKIFR